MGFLNVLEESNKIIAVIRQSYNFLEFSYKPLLMPLDWIGRKLFSHCVGDSQNPDYMLSDEKGHLTEVKGSQRWS
jgi:hypothetical protein